MFCVWKAASCQTDWLHIWFVLQVFDGWVLKGEKFPSSNDHPLLPHERYTDYCSSSAKTLVSRSSQNVAMIFFRIHSPDSGFSLTVKQLHNPMRESCSTTGNSSFPLEKFLKKVLWILRNAICNRTSSASLLTLFWRKQVEYGVLFVCTCVRVLPGYLCSGER